jgi:hypothetical protein
MSVRERLHGVMCPVHPDHVLGLVGEAPGPRTRADCPFYPYPSRSAAGRLLTYLGWSRSRYLLTFARMNLLAEWPGEHFPIGRARECVPNAVEVMYPRPMLLMGRGVAAAFGVSMLPILTLVEVVLPRGREGPVPAKVAVVPHTSGRNPWYNDPANQRRVKDFIEALLPPEAQVNEQLATPRLPA